MPVYFDKLLVERLSKSICRSRNLESFTRRRRLSFFFFLSFFLSFLALSALAGSSSSTSSTGLVVGSGLKVFSFLKFVITANYELKMSVRLVLFSSNSETRLFGGTDYNGSNITRADFPIGLNFAEFLFQSSFVTSQISTYCVGPGSARRSRKGLSWPIERSLERSDASVS